MDKVGRGQETEAGCHGCQEKDGGEGSCCREFNQLGHALEGSPDRVRECLWALGLCGKIKHLSWLINPNEDGKKKRENQPIRQCFPIKLFLIMKMFCGELPNMVAMCSSQTLEMWSV